MCYTFTVLECDQQKLPRIAIVGPTAVGKTAVGVAVAEALGGEIISADSMQVYRGMDIGTAKPTLAERSQVRFHAIDVVDLDETWTLTDFQRLGERVCATAAALHAPVLIVGGTGLYVRALTMDLAIPHTPPNEDFRTRWRSIAANKGNPEVRRALAVVDPISAARIHVNDLGRLIRALEVHAATGVTLTEWHLKNQAEASTRNVRLFGLNFADRRLLYQRIEARVDQMVADGFVEEVRSLLQAGCARDLKPMQSLGYRQIASFLADETNWDQAVASTKQETRQFARRQLIWFRADKRIHWLDATGKTMQDLAGEIQAVLKS